MPCRELQIPRKSGARATARSTRVARKKKGAEEGLYVSGRVEGDRCQELQPTRERRAGATFLCGMAALVRAVWLEPRLGVRIPDLTLRRTIAEAALGAERAGSGAGEGARATPLLLAQDKPGTEGDTNQSGGNSKYCGARQGSEPTVIHRGHPLYGCERRE